MNPLVPAPDTIPVAWGWFQLLLMLTFPLHLLLMNAMLGSALVALFLHRNGGEVQMRLAHGLARVLPGLIAFTVNLGVAALLFVQVLYGQFIYTSSVLMGVYWLSVIPLLILAYYATYLYDFRFSRLGRRGLLVLGTAVLIFLAIPFLFTNNMTLMLQPREWLAYFQNPSGTVLNLSDPSLWPRYLHMVVGGTAVGGLFVALYGRWRMKADPEAGSLAVDLGMKVFIWLTLLETVLGFWFLMSLPREVMLRFMGGDALATGAFVLGLLLTAAVLFAGFRRKVALTAFLTVLMLYVMSFMRDEVREGYLAPLFSPAQLEVAPQYSPMILFFVVLAVGLATLVWMFRKVAEIPSS